MKNCRFLVTIAFLLAWITFANAQDSLNIRTVGALTLPTNGALDVAMMGNIAVVAGSTNGVSLIDLTLPETPQLLATYDTPGMARKVVVQDSIAYVADGSAGLLILSLTNPSQPALLGTFATPDFAQAIRILGETVYLGGADQLRILSVSDLTSPQLLGSYNPPGSISDLQVRDSLVYLTGMQNGIRIVNVADPTQPLPVGQLNTRNNAFALTLFDTLAYVADYTAGLTILSITDPTAPRIVGFYDTPGTANSVVNGGNGMVCVGDYDHGFRLIDASNPEQLIEIAYYDTPGFTYGLMMWQQYFVVADNSSLRIYEQIIDDVTTPSASLLTSSFQLHSTYPNPFNATTTISFSLQNAGTVALVVFDANGRQLATIANREFAVGNHTISFDASGYAAGSYFLQATSHRHTITKLLLLLK